LHDFKISQNMYEIYSRSSTRNFFKYRNTSDDTVAKLAEMKLAAARDTAAITTAAAKKGTALLPTLRFVRPNSLLMCM